jgi:hypothetical protein
MNNQTFFNIRLQKDHNDNDFLDFFIKIKNIPSGVTSRTPLAPDTPNFFDDFIFSSRSNIGYTTL